MRVVLNGLIVLLLLVAAGFAAVLVVLESAWLLSGGGSRVGPVDYMDLWDTITGWDPARWVVLAAYAGAIVIGAAILILQVLPRGKRREVEIARGEKGVVMLDERTVRPVLADRVKEHDWVRDARPKVRLDGISASVASRPATVRPWDDSEVKEIHSELLVELERLGLEPGEVTVQPRPPSGRGVRRVK